MAGVRQETDRAGRDGNREAGALQYMAKSLYFILFVEKPLRVV